MPTGSHRSHRDESRNPESPGASEGESPDAARLASRAHPHPEQPASPRPEAHTLGGETAPHDPLNAPKPAPGSPRGRRAEGLCGTG